MKNRNKRIAWSIFTAFCLGLTPYIFHLADLTRSKPGTGGEVVILLLPIIVWVIDSQIQEFREVWNENVK